MRRLLVLSSFVLLFLVNTSYAPVPRCSPFIIINKIPESSNFMNDFNPYFPVPECEYGGPLQAMLAGDYASVSLLADGAWKIPRHNLYEGLWLFTKGPAKIKKFLSGEEQFEFDPSIIFEGYSHDRGTKRIGDTSHRDTTLIENDDLYAKGIEEKANEGDKTRSRSTITVILKNLDSVL